MPLDSYWSGSYWAKSYWGSGYWGSGVVVTPPIIPATYGSAPRFLLRRQQIELLIDYLRCKLNE